MGGRRTDAFATWYAALEDDAALALNAAVDRLEQDGPTLGEPLGKRIVGSRLHNLKELRISVGGHRIRVLFAFDPARNAVLLIGGDKTGQSAEARSGGMTVHRWRDISAPTRTRPGAAEAIERYRREIDEQIRLADLRRARSLTQVQLGEAMGKPQSTISRMEKQTDLYLSTLRRYVEAMGGRLEIRAVFPDATVSVSGFGALSEEDSEAAERETATSAARMA